MSLKPQKLGAIPEETARVAKAACPKGNLCLTLRDELGTLFSDEQFVDLFPTRGQPAQAPWRLALVTILQFVENLPDRQAAEAVRNRIDWKYLLGLELTNEIHRRNLFLFFRQPERPTIALRYALTARLCFALKAKAGANSLCLLTGSDGPSAGFALAHTRLPARCHVFGGIFRARRTVAK